MPSIVYSHSTCSISFDKKVFGQASMLKVVFFLVLAAVAYGQDDARRVRYNRYVPPSVYRRPVYSRPVVYNPNTADVDVRSRVDRLNYVDDESPKPYSFSYTAPEEGGIGSSSRTEVADGTGRVEGSYTLVNGEGHTRVVDYVSDVDGFRATVRTDEPGTGNQSPASVNFLSTAPNVYSNVEHRPEVRAHRHPVSYRAPVPVAPVVEEVINVDQPSEQPIVEQPLANVVPHRPANYYAHRRPYYAHSTYPGYRRDVHSY